MPQGEKYDLYISQGCDELPDLSDLAHAIPEVTYSAFQQAIIMDLAATLGFLHLNVERETAFVLLERLRARSARGLLVKAAYRQPELSLEKAYAIALREKPKVQAANPDIVFDEVNFVNIRPTTYEFIVLSNQLAAGGYIPSGVFIHIDKLDGHIWHKKDFIAWHRESGEEHLSI